MCGASSLLPTPTFWRGFGRLLRGSKYETSSIVCPGWPGTSSALAQSCGGFPDVTIWWSLLGWYYSPLDKNPIAHRSCLFHLCSSLLVATPTFLFCFQFLESFTTISSFFSYLPILLQAGWYVPQAELSLRSQSTRLSQRTEATAVTAAACAAQRWMNCAPSLRNLSWISLQILSVFGGLWLGRLWVNFQGSSKTVRVVGVVNVVPTGCNILSQIRGAPGLLKKIIKAFLTVSKDFRKRN